MAWGWVEVGVQRSVRSCLQVHQTPMWGCQGGGGLCELEQNGGSWKELGVEARLQRGRTEGLTA